MLAQGERKRPEEYIDRIAAVRAEDINRIADRMLASRPTVAAIGDLNNLPDVKEIELGLLDRKQGRGDPKNRFTKKW